MQRRDANSIQDPQAHWSALQELEDWLQTPMMLLSFVWLMLVVAELVWGSSRFLDTFGMAIWVVFVIEFAIRLSLAPRKRAFLKSNVLTLLALALPALRLVAVFRVFRFARALRGVRLLRIVGTANRGMNTLRRALGRRGFGYVAATTIVVTLLGAAGMLAFEPASRVPGGFENFGDALWWTAMLITTMGSGFWPITGEGRLLCLLLSLYAFTVFGYITATLASFFVGRDVETGIPEAKQLAALSEEIARLREQLDKPKTSS